MAVRNRAFPASRRTITKSKTHFNARGAVNAPVFTLARPAGHKGISLKVNAHCLGDRQWIAEGYLINQSLLPATICAKAKQVRL